MLAIFHRNTLKFILLQLNPLSVFAGFFAFYNQPVAYLHVKVTFIGLWGSIGFNGR